ncbi:MAG: hypothetical protein Tsb009_26130 [Planctomycetaceae bacterium]
MSHLQLSLFAQVEEGLSEVAERLGNTPYYVLGGYLVVLLILGIVGWLKSSADEDDYYLAGRGQGWIVSSVTIMATFFSSFALLGAPGMVYREGLMFALFSLNVPVAGVCVYLLGSRIWKVGRKFGYVTPGDMVSDYYGSKTSLRVLVAIASILYVIPYVVMQIQSGGILTEKLFPGQTVSLGGLEANAFEAGSIILAAITMVYIMIGGMRSVAWTDLIQGLMLITGMLVSGLAMILVFGSPGEFSQKVSSDLPDSSLTLPGNTGTWEWTLIFTVCVLGSSGSMVQPAQWMRFYSAKSVDTLRRGAVIFAVVLTTCFILGVMLIGIAGQILYPLTFTVSQDISVDSGKELPEKLAIPKSFGKPEGQAKPRFEYIRDAKDPGKATVSWSWIGRKQIAMTDAQLAELKALNRSAEYQKGLVDLQAKIQRAHTDDPTDTGKEIVRAKPSAHPAIKDYNSILVTVISTKLPKQFPLWGALAASLIIVAIMAASMSTADSNLHALSAVTTRDIYDRFIRPDASEREKVWFGRIVIAAATVLALVVVIVGEQPDVKNKYDVIKMIAQMGLMAIAFSAQLLPVAIDMLFLQKGTGKGAACGLAAGLFGAFLFGPLYEMLVDALGSPESLASLLTTIQEIKSSLKVHGSVWGLVFNVPIFVLVSLVTRKPDPEKIRQYQETFASND